MFSKKFLEKPLRFCLLITFLLFFVSSQGTCQYKDMPRQIIPEKDKFSFILVGDRTGSDSQSWQILDQAIHEINLLRPDFVIMIGDIIEESPGRIISIQSLWSEAIEHLKLFKMPFFIVPGNHDIWDLTSYQAWNQILGKTYYSFSYRGCRFIILNSEEYNITGEPGFGEKQLAFLKEEIQNHRQSRQLFLFFHKPVWLPSEKDKYHWPEIEALLDGTNYSVFAGHLHLLASKEYQGHRYLIAGPTGGKMRLARNPSMGFMQHYTWVTVENDSSYIAYIEPGKIYDEKLSQNAYKTYLQGLYLLKGMNPY